MAIITPQDIGNGTRIEMNDDVWQVVDFLHVKPGKGGSFVRTKIKSLSNGRVLEVTFKGSEKIVQADVEYRKMQYTHMEHDQMVFMDMESYEQTPLGREALGDAQSYLKEADEVSVLWWQEKPLSVDLPPKVDLKVVETVPGVKGDTVSNVTKAATLETGLEVQVPLFVNVGDTVRVSTRDGKYESRV